MIPRINLNLGNGKILPVPAAEHAISTAANSGLSRIVNEIHALHKSAKGNREVNLLNAYRLQLNLLNKLNVFQKDKFTLYPLIGFDLLPSEYAPIIGIDAELRENISDPAEVKNFIEEFPIALRKQPAANR